MDALFAVSVFVAIIAIVNPIGAVSFFSGLTQGCNKEEKMKIAKKAIISATLILIIFGLIGQYIFMVFSITIPAFRIAGGLLLFRVAFNMLYGVTPGTKITDREKKESLEKELTAIVPMGIPMMAGPGAISTVMLYVSQGNIGNSMIVFLCIILTMGFTYFLLRNADKIFDRLGRVGSLAISRILGLILAAVAIQFIVNGAHDIALEWVIEMSNLSL
jgi:multiple antibiotic resistance protein